MTNWFEDIPTAAERYAASLEHTKLDRCPALGMPKTRKDGLFESFRAPRLYEHGNHVFGFVPPSKPDTKELPVVGATSIQADATLETGKIKISLDRLRVANYPGRGVHKILFDFYAQNQLESGGVEHVHFNSYHQARDGDEVAVLGYPLFVGLSVGSEGVMLKCRTVNVGSSSDEMFLSVLDDDVFRNGLLLAEKANPVVGMLSKLAYNLTYALAKRTKNLSVQDFCLGLDFSNIATRARLAEGSFVAAQVSSADYETWDWSRYALISPEGRIVDKGNGARMLQNNYVVVGVSRMKSAE